MELFFQAVDLLSDFLFQSGDTRVHVLPGGGHSFLHPLDRAAYLFFHGIPFFGYPFLQLCRLLLDLVPVLIQQNTNRNDRGDGDSPWSDCTDQGADAADQFRYKREYGSHTLHKLAAYHKYRTNSCGNSKCSDNQVFRAFVQRHESVHCRLDFLNYRSKILCGQFAKGVHQDVKRRFQFLNGTAKSAHHGLCHFICGSSCGMQTVRQLLDILRCGIDQGKPTAHIVFAEDGTGRGDLLLLGKLGKTVVQQFLHLYGVFHRPVGIEHTDAQLVQHLCAFLRGLCESGKAGLQGVRGGVGVNTVIGHGTHIQGSVLNGIPCRMENWSRDAHSLRQTVHIQCGVVAGGGEYIRISRGVLKAVSKTVDGGDQSRGYGVQVAAFTGSEVHRRCESLCCLLRVQTGAGKVQDGVRRVRHAESGICSRLRHCPVKQFSLFRCVPHGLVCQRHGFVHFGKVLHCDSTGGDYRRGDLHRQVFSGLFHLAAQFFHLFADMCDLLCGN